MNATGMMGAVGNKKNSKAARVWLDEEISEFIRAYTSELGLSPHIEREAEYSPGQWLGQHSGGRCREAHRQVYRNISASNCEQFDQKRPLSRSVLDGFIAKALARSIGHMTRHSLFYKEKLAGYQEIIQAIEGIGYALREQKTTPPSADENKQTTQPSEILPELLKLIEALPFTTSHELAQNSEAFLSIGHSSVAGLISVPTSGTTGERKRVFCSEFDLERTIRFFSYGMRLLLPEIHGQRVLLLMSGDREGSVGHLLRKGLEHWSIPCDIYGFPMDMADMANCLKAIDATAPTCIVGLPSHLMTLCRLGLSPRALTSLKSVLLSGEWASPTIQRHLEEALGCPVFLHYGLTESGLAGAVECSARAGCHIREADIHVNIVDAKGHTLPDGEWGEIVLTTLTRQATPLLRYKTGDWGRIMPGFCSCGSVIKRLEAGGRLNHRIALATGRSLGFGELDAALFSLPWVVAYTLTRPETTKNAAMASDEPVDAVPAPVLPKKNLQGLTLHLDCLEPFTPRHRAEVVAVLKHISALTHGQPRNEKTEISVTTDAFASADSLMDILTITGAQVITETSVPEDGGICGEALAADNAQTVGEFLGAQPAESEPIRAETSSINSPEAEPYARKTRGKKQPEITALTIARRAPLGKRRMPFIAS